MDPEILKRGGWTLTGLIWGQLFHGLVISYIQPKGTGTHLLDLQYRLHFRSKEIKNTGQNINVRIKKCFEAYLVSQAGYN